MTHLEQTASPGTERGKPTPGPWSVAEGSAPFDGEWEITAPDAVGDFPWSVAMTFSGAGFHRLEGEAESQANARLIAAAPTMLEALQKLANEVGGLRAFESELRAELGNTNWSVLMRRLREAEAAIALAEGRTPNETKGGASDE